MQLRFGLISYWKHDRLQVLLFSNYVLIGAQRQLLMPILEIFCLKLR